VTVTADRAEQRLDQTALLRELEPVVEDNLNRHLGVAKEWFPHEYVPWSQGRDFDGVLDGEAWDAAQSGMSEVARTSLVVNLLTEDNLPSYHHEIATAFGRDGAWGTWVHRWTAEEGRHGIAIRDYLLATRAVDPVALERARMAHMGVGFESDNRNDLLRSLAYVSFQELATRIAHRNTGKLTADPVCEQLLARIALDENLHMLFYRNLLGATLELAPNQAMRAITEVVKSFQMPGHTIEDFTRKSVQIAMAGVYDLRIHHDDVIAPVLRAWGVMDLEGLDADGEAAREELVAFLAGLDAAATRFEDQRAARRERLTARGQAYESV
jgi:acyl-[acyl-carrier-protein] desaturase